MMQANAFMSRKTDYLVVGKIQAIETTIPIMKISNNSSSLVAKAYTKKEIERMQIIYIFETHTRTLEKLHYFMCLLHHNRKN